MKKQGTTMIVLLLTVVFLTSCSLPSSLFENTLYYFFQPIDNTRELKLHIKDPSKKVLFKANVSPGGTITLLASDQGTGIKKTIFEGMQSGELDFSDLSEKSVTLKLIGKADQLELWIDSSNIEIEEHHKESRQNHETIVKGTII